MQSIGIRYLKQHASAVVRRVRESGAPVAVTHYGEVVARIVPIARRSDALPSEPAGSWTDIDALAEEIGAAWPADVSAVEAVRDVRRNL